jgi:hypothetical protein
MKKEQRREILKCKARWVLKGFQDKQKLDQQTESEKQLSFKETATAATST